MARETSTIIQNVFIPARPMDVYHAVVDPERHAEVTGARVRGEAKIGGQFTAMNEFISGRYLDLDPGKRILMEWQANKWPRGSPPSIVELTLEEKDEGTELRMVQSLIPREEHEACKTWWEEFYWDALKEYFRA